MRRINGSRLLRVVLVGMFYMYSFWVSGCGKTSNTDVNKIADRLTENLQDRLDAANMGDVVIADEGVYRGTINIPSGVILEGQSDGVVFTPDDDSMQEPPMQLSPSTDTNFFTTVRNIKVMGGVDGAITAQGAGRISISNVKAESAGGAAVNLYGLDELKVDQLSVSGNVTVDDSLTVPIEYDISGIAQVGLSIEDCKLGDISQISVSGFARSGVIVNNSGVKIADSRVSNNMGVGVFASGDTDLELVSVEVEKTMAGSTAFGHGVVVANGAKLLSEGLVIKESSFAALIHDNSTGQHTDIIVVENNQGVWAQFCNNANASEATIEFHGENTRFENNLGISLGGYEISGLLMDGGQIDSTLSRPMIAQGTETGRADIGDGVHLIKSTENISISNILIMDNERAGVLLDFGEDFNQNTADVSFSNCSIGGEDGERGFAVQNGDIEGEAPDVTSDVLSQKDITGGWLPVVKEISVSNIPSMNSIADRREL